LNQVLIFSLILKKKNLKIPVHLEKQLIAKLIWIAKEKNTAQAMDGLIAQFQKFAFLVLRKNAWMAALMAMKYAMSAEQRIVPA